MSIFEGWDRETLAELYRIVTGSWGGVAALAVFAIIAVLLIVVVGLYVSHQVSGFYLKIQKEDEEAAREEEEREKAETQEESEKE